MGTMGVSMSESGATTVRRGFGMSASTARRVALAIGLVSIALILGAVVFMFIDRHVASLVGTSNQWNVSNVLGAVVNIAVPSIGILLASRRRENLIGWVFLAAGFTIGLSGFATAYAVHALEAEPGSLPWARALAWVGSSFGLVPLAMLCFLFLLFPTGHLRSPRWRPVARLVAGSFVLVTGLSTLSATQSWHDPYGESSSPVGPFTWLLLLLFVLPLLGSLVASLAAVIVRFRGSAGEERLQLKWFVTGAALVVASFVGAFLTSSCNDCSPPVVVSVFQSVAFVFLWTAIAIAVLKYRLYEIDVVISKAVLYGTLAVFITIVYVGLVVGVGTLVGHRGSPLLSAVAAAVIAVAFQPVRESCRRVANRVVYGKRATPYEVLSDFAERIAGTYASEDVLPQMARIVAAGTGAERTVVWLRVGDELRAEASSGALPDVAVLPIEGDALPTMPPGETGVPVLHQGELLGSISIRMPPRETLSPEGQRLITDVASQAGLVLSNVRLIEELRASRQRIVSAQDQARRRLERNIHDGAQQQLVAIAVKLRMANQLMDRDAERSRMLHTALEGELAGALETLRDLARGIYPPLLADQGLVAALSAQAQKASVPVDVEASSVGRYPQEVEAAVYFSVLEGLQNVAKYAEASRAMVRLSKSDGELSFEVIDDGHGFDSSAATFGTGLQGIADRLAALDGTLEVRSKPGEGTTLSGRVPA